MATLGKIRGKKIIRQLGTLFSRTTNERSESDGKPEKDHPRSRPSPYQRPAATSPNQLLHHSIRDENLDEALQWLKNSAKDQDNSDVWHYAQHWQQHKADLQQRIRNGSFTFQTVRDIKSKNSDGTTRYREIRCAEDRLLIRAISHVLKPVVAAVTPKECTHLATRGGTKTAVKDLQEYLSQHPTSHVFKSDVKRYYASISHSILYQQLCELLPQEKALCRLLWQFMQRTVERGGNYREIDQGLPLGASLSPLFAALYLIPLDTAFHQRDDIFYRRYMDDWVIVCKTRWGLRTISKQVYAVLKSLRVDVHPDKTYLGKAQKGFDFLGFRVTPTSTHPSTQSVSRRDKKITQLYEQGASKRRIGLYLSRWLGWATLVACTTATAVGPNAG
ncbi:MAG: group II intron reverse transcriptase domain-containing protein, partial [Methylococcales bacterium]|nr:group II intron reverse transcriptase domain-containing protein [Methylococcales bacterium]